MREQYGIFATSGELWLSRVFLLCSARGLPVEARFSQAFGSPHAVRLYGYGATRSVGFTVLTNDISLQVVFVCPAQGFGKKETIVTGLGRSACHFVMSPSRGHQPIIKKQL